PPPVAEARALVSGELGHHVIGDRQGDEEPWHGSPSCATAACGTASQGWTASPRLARRGTERQVPPRDGAASASLAEGPRGYPPFTGLGPEPRIALACGPVALNVRRGTCPQIGEVGDAVGSNPLPRPGAGAARP